MHGVGFLNDEETAKNLLMTEYVSERIAKIKVREGRKMINFFRVYVPCNDSLWVTLRAHSESVRKWGHHCKGTSMGELTIGETMEFIYGPPQ